MAAGIFSFLFASFSFAFFKSATKVVLFRDMTETKLGLSPIATIFQIGIYTSYVPLADTEFVSNRPCTGSGMTEVIFIDIKPHKKIGTD